MIACQLPNSVVVIHMSTHWDSQNNYGEVTGTALLGVGHCHYSLYASKKLFAIIGLSQLSGILRTCVWESPQLYCNNSLRASVRESLQVLALFPGPAQLSVACSTKSDGKLGGAWERVNKVCKYSNWHLSDWQTKTDFTSSVVIIDHVSTHWNSSMRESLELHC